MRLSFDLFDVFAFLDRPSLDKAAYVCRRFDAVIEEQRMKSLCLRSITRVLVEYESTTYSVGVWTAQRGNGRASLQFRRVNFQEKLRLCLRHSRIDTTELEGVGVNEKFLTMLECGLDQTKHLGLTNVVFPTHSTVNLFLACFKDLQSVRLADTTQDERVLDELLRCCSENEVPAFHCNVNTMASSDAIVQFCFGGRDLPNRARKLRFPMSYYDVSLPETLWDDIIEANRECGHRGPLDVEIRGLEPFHVISKYPVSREGPLLFYRENDFEIKCDSRRYAPRLSVKRNT